MLSLSEYKTVTKQRLDGTLFPIACLQRTQRTKAEHGRPDSRKRNSPPARAHTHTNYKGRFQNRTNQFI
jgi:hypothetical protein